MENSLFKITPHSTSVGAFLNEGRTINVIIQVIDELFRHENWSGLPERVSPYPGYFQLRCERHIKRKLLSIKDFFIHSTLTRVKSIRAEIFIAIGNSNAFPM